MADMRICQKDDEGISNCRQGEYRFTNKSNRMYEIAIFITETRSITMIAFKIHYTMKIAIPFIIYCY